MKKKSGLKKSQLLQKINRNIKKINEVKSCITSYIKQQIKTFQFQMILEKGRIMKNMRSIYECKN